MIDRVDIDELLKTAHQITHGIRSENYGPAHEDYARVAAIFQGITDGEVRDAADAALFMVAMKLARIGYNRGKRRLHLDSVIDAAGYLWVYAQCANDLEHDLT